MSKRTRKNGSKVAFETLIEFGWHVGIGVLVTVLVPAPGVGVFVGNP